MDDTHLVGLVQRESNPKTLVKIQQSDSGDVLMPPLQFQRDNSKLSLPSCALELSHSKDACVAGRAKISCPNSSELLIRIDLRNNGHGVGSGGTFKILAATTCRSLRGGLQPTAPSDKENRSIQIHSLEEARESDKP
jgi:hypothetical protein